MAQVIPPRRRPPRRAVMGRLAIVALTLFGVAPYSPGGGAAASAQENKPGGVASEEAAIIAPGRPLRQSISGREVRRATLRMDAGQYARLDIEQSGAGLRVEILKPSGSVYSSAACLLGGTRSLSVVADRAGTYSVVLRLQDGEGQELYELSLNDARPSVANDARRLRAEAALDEAVRLRAEWKAGAMRAALRLYGEALLLFQQIGDAAAQARTHHLIGEAYQSLSEPQRAFTHYRQSLAAGERGGSRREQADALNAIGGLHCILGDNQEAFDALQRAHRLSVAGDYRRGEAAALVNLGDTYYGLGELAKGVESINRALGLLRSLGDRHGQAKALVSLGYTLVELSEMEKALDSYQQAVALSHALRDRRMQAVSLRALGNLRTLMGDRQEALTTLTLALRASDGVDDLPTKADVFGGLGYLYDGLGEKAMALDYYERALAIFRGMNHRWGMAEVGMVIGGIHYSAGDYAKALGYYHQSLSMFRALVMPRYEAWMLRDIGLIYDTMGEKQKALDYYRQALSVAKSGQDQRYTAHTLNYMGRTYESLGDWQAALGYYEQALPLSRVAGDRAGEAAALYNLAHVERARGNLEPALRHAEAAVTISESLRTKVGGHELRAAYLGTVHQQFTLYTDILMRLHRERPADGFDVMAFEASERGRARALLEALAESRAGIRQGVDEGLLRRERELQRQLNAAVERRIKLAGGEASDDETAAVERELGELTTAYQQVQGQIRASSPRYAALVQPAPLTLKEIQRQVLDADTLLLAYTLGEERSFVWAVTPDSIKSFELAARTDIEDAARRVYTLLTTRNRQERGETAEQRRARVARDEGQYADASRKLSEMLLGRVAGELQRKRLVVVADGALQYVPFAALPAPDGHAAAGRRRGTAPENNPPTSRAPASPRSGSDFVPLIAEYEIVSLPSASVLALLREELRGRRPAPKAVAVLADPVFDEGDERLTPVKTAGRRRQDAAAARRAGTTDGGDGGAAPDVAHRALRDFDGLGGGIARLPFSRREAEAIMASVPADGGMLALGFRASRATATGAELSQYRVVHFATHGLLNSKHPELSGVVLSRFDESGRSQNGFLQLHDIYNLNLPAELVVLSACQTALGKEIRGEGLVGLTRGFMYAGAPRVIASLWKVDDAATAELMGEFYRAMLAEGMRPAEALRAAQVRMWQQNRWHSPYYWAAFTLQGEWM